MERMMTMGNLTLEERRELQKMQEKTMAFHPRAEGDMPTVAEQEARRTGLEILRDPATTVEEIAGLLRDGHPPVGPVDCDHVTCRECWLAWLTTGEAPVATERREKP